MTNFNVRFFQTVLIAEEVILFQAGVVNNDSLFISPLSWEGSRFHSQRNVSIFTWLRHQTLIEKSLSPDKPHLL